MCTLHTSSTFQGAVIGWAWKPIEGVGVRDVRASAGLQGLVDHRLRVGVEPLAEQDGHLLVWLRERVPLAELGQDDERAVEVQAQPGEVRVPPQRAALPGHGEVVRVALPALDRALRDVRRTVRPTVTQLSDAVPVSSIHHSCVMVSCGLDDSYCRQRAFVYQ
jgi:hypothetical protein